MGLYDTIRDESSDREGQVKLWDSDMNYYNVGDEVPNIARVMGNYSIAMREGGYVNIHENRVASWTDNPTETLVLDKYGDEFDPNTFQGLMGEAGFGKESYFNN